LGALKYSLKIDSEHAECLIVYTVHYTYTEHCYNKQNTCDRNFIY